MSFLRISVVVFSIFIMSASGRGAEALPPPGYQLVWADDFSQQPNGAPDPGKWGYEEGFIRNGEMQYYTKDRRENARIENGLLVIEGRRENYHPPAGAPPAQPGKSIFFTSAALETRGKTEWLFGRMEVKAKLPAGNGVWPAIWTLGADVKTIGWPKCGEIDIMELVGKEPERVHGTVHFFTEGKHQSRGAETRVQHPENDFHVYAIEWTPDHIDFFVDEQKYFSFDVAKADNHGTNPFLEPHFLILNLALGGTWGGHIDNSIFPQRMSIAYVRIYQKSPATPVSP